MTGKFLFSAVLFWHLVTVAKGWWCQASHGSCTGQRHKFQKDASLEVQLPFSGKDYGLLRFADWDSDGDMDILVAENESLWFYERLPGLGDFFEKHEVIRFSSFRSSFEVPYSHWFGEKGFEVADWDGDWQLFDFHCFLFFWRFCAPKHVVSKGYGSVSTDLLR